MTTDRHDLTRTTLAVLFIVGLIVVSFLVVRPFLAATVWAATLVIATWPVMKRVQARFGGRRGPAVALMTVVLLLLVVLPLSMAISAVAGYAALILTLPQDALHLPPPPAWLADVPVVGGPIVEKWRNLADGSRDELISLARPYLKSVMEWVLQAAGSVGQTVVQLLLTIAIVAVLYAKGEHAAFWCLSFGRRLAGERGEEVVVLAGQAIRGVALGVVVTALVQSLCTGIALVVAGVPQAGLLTAVTLFLCLMQLGPGLIVLPSIIWLFATDQTVSGLVLVVIGVPAVLMDNFLRPILIRLGADLPLLLILVGVIGGLLAFGMLGLFLGPVILAVTYTLLQHWIGERKEG